MSKKLLIGVDLGTSGVKLLLMDEEGTILNIVTKTYDVSFPKEGWSEQEPAAWYHRTLEGLADLLKDADKASVAGIGVGGQMHGLVVLDEKDQVLRPAILWNDGRSVKETAYLNEEIGREKLRRYTGNIAFPGFTAPKILWMQKNEPELWKRVCKIMLPKDYLVYRLSGSFSTDLSDASGMLLLDVEHRCWSKEMLELCHVSEQMLPRLYESYEAVGTLKKDLTEELGLPENVMLCAGAGDNAAAAIGTGTIGEGGLNISLGTSGTTFLSSKSYASDPGFAMHGFCHADGGYHMMGCMLSAASCNNWWMEKILQTSEFEKEQEGLLSKCGHNNIFFLPYLMGERCPHNDANIRGAFLGLSMDSSRQDMTLAMMEGVAFAIRDCVEPARALGVDPKKATICGGGAKSPLWRQIVADVLGIPLQIIDGAEGPGFGGAILAGVAAGVYASVEDAVKNLVHPMDAERPDESRVALYGEKYETYRKLYPALKGVL